MRFRFRIPFTNTMVASRAFILRKLEIGRSLGHDHTKPKVWGYVLGVYDSAVFGLCIYRERQDTSMP